MRVCMCVCVFMYSGSTRSDSPVVAVALDPDGHVEVDLVVRVVRLRLAQVPLDARAAQHDPAENTRRVRGTVRTRASRQDSHWMTWRRALVQGTLRHIHDALLGKDSPRHTCAQTHAPEPSCAWCVAPHIKVQWCTARVPHRHTHTHTPGALHAERVEPEAKHTALNAQHSHKLVWCTHTSLPNTHTWCLHAHFPHTRT